MRQRGSGPRGHPQEIATEVSVNTAYGVERLVRYAFEQAQKRPARHLTLVHKHNVLVNAGHLWRRTVEAVGAEYPEVSVDYNHVDAATIYLVTDPGRFDVIVTDNLFGDILTDEAGAVYRRASACPLLGNINPTGPSPPCSSPFTAPHRTSPGRARPIQLPPSAQSPCCWSTSGSPVPLLAYMPPSMPTWLHERRPTRLEHRWSVPRARSVMRSPQDFGPESVPSRFWRSSGGRRLGLAPVIRSIVHAGIRWSVPIRALGNGQYARRAI